MELKPKSEAIIAQIRFKINEKFFADEIRWWNSLCSPLAIQGLTFECGADRSLPLITLESDIIEMSMEVTGC